MAMENQLNLQAVTVEERYAALIESLAGGSNATVGSGKRGFGSSALQLDGKIFAMLSKGRLVVKLPRQRVDALVSEGFGQRFDPGHGRLMKKWFALERSADEDWLSLAREAIDFIASKR
jgi:TfoX/Sxy family transcriptional regulator of competence genes